MFKKVFLLEILILIVFGLLASYTYASENVPLIHTPTNSEIYEDTWQEKAIIYMGSIWNFVGKNILGGKIGKELKDAQKAREQALEDSIAERMKEKMPLDYLNIYEDYLHKMEIYKKYEKEIKSIDDLDTLIDHLEKQKKKMGNRLNKSFKEYLEELKHMRDKEKEYQENKEKFTLQTATTITMSIITLLGLIAGSLAGVGA